MQDHAEEPRGELGGNSGAGESRQGAQSDLTPTERLSLALASERIARAQADLRAAQAERAVLLEQVRRHYNLGAGDGVDFATGAILRTNGETS